MKRLVVFAALLALGGCKSLDVEAPAKRAEVHQIGLSGETLATERGAAYAQAKCAGCHSVGRTGDSPLEAAPDSERWASCIRSKTWPRPLPRVSTPPTRRCPSSSCPRAKTPI